MGRPSDYREEIADAICGRMVCIYALTASGSNEIRYIGKANDAGKRLVTHIRDSRRRNTPVYCWIRKLISQGLYPEIRVLETVPESKWKDTEIRLIAAHKGPRLLNVAEGGDEPYCSTEIRSANGKKNAAKYWTKESRSTNGRHNAKRLHSDPARKRWWKLVHALSADLSKSEKIGFHYSENHRKKLVLNCMAIAELHPDKVPASWRELKWDVEELGDLNLETIKTCMSPFLFNRIDFTEVYP